MKVRKVWLSYKIGDKDVGTTLSWVDENNIWHPHFVFRSHVGLTLEQAYEKEKFPILH